MVTDKSCIFIGYDRARDLQQRLERTRKHLAILLDTPYPEFSEHYAWTNFMARTRRLRREIVWTTPDAPAS
jgi:hypothetical protein